MCNFQYTVVRRQHIVVLNSIFFGGGTPSLLPPASIGRILETIDRHFALAKDAEISLEANPGTVSLQGLAGYRCAGVNRISLGLQSCNDRHLTNLGRIHNRCDGLESVKTARQAGFENISLDLMFALPGQSQEELGNDLDSYLELAPERLSTQGEAGDMEDAR